MTYGSITVQMGHVPRTRGSTGTVREQEFTRALGAALETRLRSQDWEVHLIGADPPGRDYPRTDLFLALHCDGSSSAKAGGASYFYPPRCRTEGEAWGRTWAAAHQRVAEYGFGFRSANYVASVSTDFYAWRSSRVRVGNGTPASVCLLCEHYFATNPDESTWAWTPGRIEMMADAHTVALERWVGHPRLNPATGDHTDTSRQPALSSPLYRRSTTESHGGSDDMYLAIDTDKNLYWLVAGQRARPIQKVEDLKFDGPVRSSPNMRHVIADLFDIVGD